MPEIGGVKYDEEGFEFMREIAAQRRLDGTLPGTLENEAAVIHEIYRTFPGVKMVSEPSSPPSKARGDLLDPF